MKKTTLLFRIVVCLVLGSHFPLSAAAQEDLGTLTLPEGWTVQLRTAETPASPAPIGKDDDGGDDDESLPLNTTFVLSDGVNTLTYSFRVLEVLEGELGSRIHLKGRLVLDVPSADDGNDGETTLAFTLRFQEGFDRVPSLSIGELEDWQEFALTLQTQTGLAGRIDEGLQALQRLNPSLDLRAAIAPTVLLLVDQESFASAKESFDLLPAYPRIEVFDRVRIFDPVDIIDIDCVDADGTIVEWRVDTGSTKVTCSTSVTPFGAGTTRCKDRKGREVVKFVCGVGCIEKAIGVSCIRIGTRGGPKQL